MNWGFGVAALGFAVALSYVNRRIGFRKGFKAAPAVVYVFAQAVQDEENKK